ncbi:hypothetical protein PoB_004730300 [Plakobranchus ocellatus]|uniref:Uncharacterized protein n=1 Tax=Plakobranchus ocellatus TaxID=259542 RepID=A0AAV4BMK4_9GAST|nr:hypothetical protein PoB_004730300 [Plakobranchus ocellatus]
MVMISFCTDYYRCKHDGDRIYGGPDCTLVGQRLDLSTGQIIAAAVSAGLAAVLITLILVAVIIHKKRNRRIDKQASSTFGSSGSDFELKILEKGDNSSMTTGYPNHYSQHRGNSGGSSSVYNSPADAVGSRSRRLAEAVSEWRSLLASSLRGNRNKPLGETQRVPPRNSLVDFGYYNGSNFVGLKQLIHRNATST